MRKGFLLAAVATAVGLGGASSALSQDFGSAVISTYRSCASVTSAQVCDGTTEPILWPMGSPFGFGAGAPYGPSAMSGGDMLSASTSFTQADSSSSSSLTFNTINSQPVMSGSSNSQGDNFPAVTPNVRIGSDGVAFYTYTNTSSVPVALTLSAAISFDSSSVSQPSSPGVNGWDLPGGGYYDAFDAIVSGSWLNSQLSGPNSAAYGSGLTGNDAFDYDMIFGVLANLTGFGCNQGGVAAYGFTGGPTTGGSGSGSVSTSACFGGGAFIVTPGESVEIIDGYQLISNRGGEIDPFTLTFTDAPPPIDLSTTAPIPSPEPAAWMLMLTGVGLVGRSLRRRARLAKLIA